MRKLWCRLFHWRHIVESYIGTGATRWRCFKCNPVVLEGAAA